MSGVCVFGGAFDPPHLSHRRVVETALAALSPDRLLVIPCGDRHPTKDPPVATAEHRLRMCSLAFADLTPTVEVDRRELDREGPSYTIDTIRQLGSQSGLDESLYLLVGADNVGTIDRWREHHSLLELATIVVFPRRGHAIDERLLSQLDLRRKHKDDILEHVLDMRSDAVNSTDIRARLAGGERCEDVLEPAVSEYALSHALYAAP